MPATDAQEKTTTDAKQPQIESKPAAEGQGKSKMMLILILAVVVLGAGAGGAFFALPWLRGGKAAAKQQASLPAATKEKVKTTLALDPFLVNLADPNEVRFVKTTFQLGLGEEPKEEAKSPVAVAAIRDSIISLLSSKTSEEILTPEGKNKLREEIRSRVNAVSPQIKVLEVYIVDFVVQL